MTVTSAPEAKAAPVAKENQEVVSAVEEIPPIVTGKFLGPFRSSGVIPSGYEVSGALPIGRCEHKAGTRKGDAGTAGTAVRLLGFSWPGAWRSVASPRKRPDRNLVMDMKDGGIYQNTVNEPAKKLRKDRNMVMTESKKQP